MKRIIVLLVCLLAAFTITEVTTKTPNSPKVPRIPAGDITVFPPGLKASRHPSPAPCAPPIACRTSEAMALPESLPGLLLAADELRPVRDRLNTFRKGEKGEIYSCGKRRNPLPASKVYHRLSSRLWGSRSPYSSVTYHQTAISLSDPRHAASQYAAATKAERCKSKEITMSAPEGWTHLRRISASVNCPVGSPKFKCGFVTEYLWNENVLITTSYGRVYTSTDHKRETRTLTRKADKYLALLLKKIS